MSRKDFELLARVFNREHELSNDNSERKATVAGLARLLASELQTTNPRFDRNRFLAACGVK